MKVALVTGGSRGLGKALCPVFAEKGYRVAINYFSRQEQALEVLKYITDRNGTGEIFQADVGKVEDVKRMVKDIVDLWGRIDVVINNAGIVMDSIIISQRIEDWDRTITTNLTGPFYIIREVAGYMKDSGGGHIINIVSYVAIKGRRGQGAYSAAKAGLIGLTRASARELGRYGIQINAVIPGAIATDMLKETGEGFHEKFMSQSTLQSYQDVMEVASFIYHLSQMRLVSGQVISLDNRIL